MVLEVPRQGQSVNKGWLLLMPSLGQLNKSHGACWSQMLLVWKNLGKSESWAKTSHLYGKATGNSVGWPESWMGQGLRVSPGWSKQYEPGGWSLRSGSHLPTLWLWWGRAWKRISGLFLGERFCLRADQLSSSHISLMSFNLLPLC